MDKNQCRLCGKIENIKLLNIEDELKKLIEYHCRIEINTLDPSKICIDCSTVLIDFSNFCENARKILLDCQEVKVEVEELLQIPEDKETLYIDEPKVEIDEDIESNDDNQVEEINESEWDDNKSIQQSDSEYEKSDDFKKQKKRKSIKPHKRIRLKRQKIFEEDVAILQDVAVADRCKNGTIRKKSLECFEGNLWKNLQLSCAECNDILPGPYELRNHHFKFHSLDTHFKCNECDPTDSLSFFYQFLNHYLDHRESLKFCCVICSDMFWNTKSLHEHYQTCHEKSDCTAIFHCKRCGQYFRKSFDLTTHEFRIHNIDSVRSDETEGKMSSITMENLFSKEFNDDEEFIQKIVFPLQSVDKISDGSLSNEFKDKYRKSMWDNITLNQCSHCSIQFPTAFLLYNHYNAEHPSSKNSFSCKSCPEQKVFLNLESFINHSFTIHHEHLRYFCFICYDGYWNYRNLYEHYKATHDDDYAAYICLYCGKYHKTGYDLKQHIEVHRNAMKSTKDKEPRTFNCLLCSKSFSRQNQLQRHQETHKKNDSKVWICEQCGRSFNAKSTLINHASVHQMEKPFKCDLCGEGFKNKYKLKHHKGIHTGVRNFGCEICGQRFRAKGTLKGHMLTHTGERPFGCEFCDKRFTAKYDLSVHTRLHTGEFTHECDICHERYPSWSNYSKHMRSRHHIDPRSEKKKKYDAIHKSIQESKDTNLESAAEQQYFHV